MQSPAGLDGALCPHTVAGLYTELGHLLHSWAAPWSRGPAEFGWSRSHVHCIFQALSSSSTSMKGAESLTL